MIDVKLLIGLPKQEHYHKRTSIMKPREDFTTITSITRVIKCLPHTSGNLYIQLTFSLFLSPGSHGLAVYLLHLAKYFNHSTACSIHMRVTFLLHITA